jgi:hypothetical protein
MAEKSAMPDEILAKTAMVYPRICLEIKSKLLLFQIYKRTLQYCRFDGTHFAMKSNTMDMRIDLKSDETGTVVRIAGRLAGRSVTQLMETCDPIEDLLVIDLSDLLFADEEGINTIRNIAEKGAKLRGASPFIKLLINNAPGWESGGELSKKPL